MAAFWRFFYEHLNFFIPAFLILCAFGLGVIIYFYIKEWID